MKIEFINQQLFERLKTQHPEHKVVYRDDGEYLLGRKHSWTGGNGVDEVTLVHLTQVSPNFWCSLQDMEHSLPSVIRDPVSWLMNRLGYVA